MAMGRSEEQALGVLRVSLGHETTRDDIDAFLAALPVAIRAGAALDLVDEEGLSALSLRSLGKRLGVSQAAFYRHFPDKAALLEGIAEQVWRLTFEAFLDRVNTGAVDSTSTPTHEASEPAEGTPASPLFGEDTEKQKTSSAQKND